MDKLGLLAPGLFEVGVLDVAIALDVVGHRGEPDGKRVIGPAGSAVMIPRFDKAPAENVTGFRSPTGEVERPHGKWNVLELVTQGDTVRQYVNGKLANEGTDPFPKEGKILIQSEGAEVYFRNIKVYPLQ